MGSEEDWQQWGCHRQCGRRYSRQWYLGKSNLVWDSSELKLFVQLGLFFPLLAHCSPCQIPALTVTGRDEKAASTYLLDGKDVTKITGGDQRRAEQRGK